MASELREAGRNQSSCFKKGAMLVSVVHWRAERYDTAAALFTKAAELGNAGAAGWLEFRYQYGKGAKKDEKKAFQLMSSAAEAGYEHAEANVPYYIRQGIGTKKDERKAIALLQRLSGSGNAWASMSLALWYKEGLGVQKDEEKVSGMK